MHLTNFHFYNHKNNLYSKLIKGLKGCEVGYGFSFNGQEKDDEVSGAGNTMTAEFWEYDSRLGRRWNVDPIPTIGISDYACFENNPICLTDVNGDSPKGDGKKKPKGTNKKAPKVESPKKEPRPSYTPPPKNLPAFPDARDLKPKGPTKRPRWGLPNGDILEWDGQHQELERYNPRGEHKDVRDPNTGVKTKDRVPGRWITPIVTAPSLENTKTVIATAASVAITYEVLKWSAAVLLAPETGGASLVVAISTP